MLPYFLILLAMIAALIVWTIIAEYRKETRKVQTETREVEAYLLAITSQSLDVARARSMAAHPAGKGIRA